MSRMSEIHMELTEQANELGFETIEEAKAHGYTIGYGKNGWRLEPDINLAHEEWLKEKAGVLADLEELKNGLDDQDELDALDRAIRFIERGEI